SPVFTLLTEAPTATTRPIASFPSGAGSCGLIPYLPRIIRSSARLIGEYSTSTVASFAAGGGGGSLSTTSTTSVGLPNLDICKNFIVPPREPYGSFHQLISWVR